MVTKIFFFILIMAILNCVYELFQFYLAFSNDEVRYTPSTLRKVLFCLSLSYITTIIFLGF
jgi:hypothetical protein